MFKKFNLQMKAFKSNGKYGLWDSKQLTAAMGLVSEGFSIRASASVHDIPEASLRRRIKLKNSVAPMLGNKTAFTTEQEKKLVKDLISFYETMGILDALHCRRLAYLMAENLKLNHKFNKREKLAGKNWLEGFLKRNPQIKLTSSRESYNTDRMHEKKMYKKKQMNKFFQNLKSLKAQYLFLPRRIYNVLETEICTVEVCLIILFLIYL